MSSQVRFVVIVVAALTLSVVLEWPLQFGAVEAKRISLFGGEAPLDIVPEGQQLANFPHPSKPGPFANEHDMLRSQGLSRLLLEVTKELTHHRLTVWVIEGALLGIYRHQTLLPWDADVDVGVLASELPSILKVLEAKFGAKLLEVKENYLRIYQPLEIDGQIIGEYFIDIYACVLRHEADDDQILTHPWLNMYACPLKFVLPVKWAQFYDALVPVPADTEEVLRISYGPAFRHPNKIFDWPKMAYVNRNISSENNEVMNYDAYPLVSVIIPTYGRSQFLLKAIELVKRQDYPNLEIVIVDDSEVSLELDKKFHRIFTKAHNQWIRYYHLPQRVSIGEKRNFAVQQTRGQIVIHWDDDDYFREFRITQQVAPIIRGEVDMTVLEHHYYFELMSKQFYVVKRLHSWGPHCGTLAYSKKIFSLGIRFPFHSIAEDYAFAESALVGGFSMKIIDNGDGKHVYIRHHNTWQFDLKTDYAAQIMAVPRPWFFSEADFDFYVHVELSPPTSSPPNNTVWPGIKWTLPQLNPNNTDDGQGLLYSGPPYYGYPHYQNPISYKHKGDHPHYNSYPNYYSYPNYNSQYPSYFNRDNNNYDHNENNYYPSNYGNDVWRLGLVVGCIIVIARFTLGYIFS
jgi:glycosyltransferase involved in cell wall biosynthesis